MQLKNQGALRRKEATMKDMIFTPHAPDAIGPYSQAVSAGGLVFVSGQLGADPSSGLLAEGGIQEQTRQSLENLRAILHAGGMDMHCVLKTTVFLRSMDDFAAMNEMYAQYFERPYPARSAIQAAALPKGALVEIEAIALARSGAHSG